MPSEPVVTDIEASDSGLRSIEHIEEIGLLVGPSRAAEFMATPLPDTVAETNCRTVASHFLRNGTWLVPTLSIRHTYFCEAVRLLFTEANLKAEPTGALAFAALLAAPRRWLGGVVCCVVSGGNVDPALYARVLCGGRTVGRATGTTAVGHHSTSHYYGINLATVGQ